MTVTAAKMSVRQGQGKLKKQNKTGFVISILILLFTLILVTEFLPEENDLHICSRRKFDMMTDDR